MTVAERRVAIEEQRWCGEHRKTLLSEYHARANQVLGKGVLTQAANATCFDLEYVAYDGATGSSWISLRQVGGANRIVFQSGMIELRTLVDKLHGTTHARPLTHDLMSSLIALLGGRLRDVLLSDVVEENTYHAKLRIENEGRLMVLDARPSDALALAVICDRPILVAHEVIRKLYDKMRGGERR